MVQGPKKLEAVGDVNGHKQYKIPDPPSLRNPEKEEKVPHSHDRWCFNTLDKHALLCSLHWSDF